MIIADTSIWADHIRGQDEAMVALLEAGGVLMHPFVLAEIALGDLPRRAVTLATLGGIRQPIVASHSEVRRLIERHAIHGSGVGYVDAHLVASAMLTDARLWTGDRRLHRVAERLGVAA